MKYKRSRDKVSLAWEELCRGNGISPNSALRITYAGNGLDFSVRSIKTRDVIKHVNTNIPVMYQIGYLSLFERVV